MNGRRPRASTRSSSASASAENDRPNAVAPLSSPGLRNSNRLHRSATRFSTGVPLSASRCSSAQQARGLRCCRVRVLDRLRFIEDDVVEVDAGQFRGVAPQRAVGDQHEIALPDLVHAIASPGSREVEQAQPRRETGSLLLPVEQHRPWHDDQRRPSLNTVGLPRMTARVEQCEHHDGLAEPHVVGKAPAESELAQERQPAEALALVIAEGAA